MPQIIGKSLIFLGILMIMIGGVILLAGKLPWLGKLPGDILVKRENFTFYFPLTTCILASVILSLIFYLFSKK